MCWHKTNLKLSTSLVVIFIASKPVEMMCIVIKRIVFSQYPKFVFTLLTVIALGRYAFRAFHVYDSKYRQSYILIKGSFSQKRCWIKTVVTFLSHVIDMSLESDEFVYYVDLRNRDLLFLSADSTYQLTGKVEVVMHWTQCSQLIHYLQFAQHFSKWTGVLHRGRTRHYFAVEIFCR